MGQHKSKLHKLKQQARYCSCPRALHELINSENVDINGFIDTDGFERITLLWLAAKHNDVSLAQLLLGVGAKVNLASGNMSMTPLHIAAYMLHEEIVSLLLDHGANTDVLDKWNYSPLMYVAINFEPVRVVNICTTLIKAGCDVNFGATLDSDGEIVNAQSTDLPKLSSHYEENGCVTFVNEPLGPISGTALHLATQNPHLPCECLEPLLEAGAAINARNLHGQIPLMGALLDTYYDYHSNIKAHAELLLKLGTDLTLTDKRGWTCFHYAAQRGSVSCMELLLRADCDCDSLGSDRVSPLWLLLVHGWREATRYLLLNGCDLDTPLSSSTIIQINQNVNVCRYGDNLPLEFALCNNYYCLALLMVRCGCKLEDSMFFGDGHDLKQREFLNIVRDCKEKALNVNSLKDMCKNVIRTTLGQGMVVKVTSLGLPTVMCDFITLTDN